ncbi:hypothetical protein FRC07_002414 [Ceratobasidium sp. 392]|nr:hypothetical protein FRC07_002414 [Ceratobasidium sp. 392]
MAPVQPGKYRIVNVASGTCMISYKDWDAVCWRRHEGFDQHWFVQRSGAGYRIRNCMSGLYLVVSETTDTRPPAKVFCGRYPTTWELNQGIKDHDMYIIKQAGCDRIIDLDGFGNDHDGNELHTFTESDWLACRRWRFEHLSNETGEEEEEILNELQTKTKQLEEKDRQLAQANAQLSSQAEELRRANFELVQRSAILAQTQETLRQVSESLAALSNQSARNDTQSANKRLEQELAQQKAKTDKLQEQLESLEQKLEFLDLDGELKLEAE